MQTNKKEEEKKKKRRRKEEEKSLFKPSRIPPAPRPRHAIYLRKHEGRRIPCALHTLRVKNACRKLNVEIFPRIGKIKDSIFFVRDPDLEKPKVVNPYNSIGFLEAF